MIESLASQLVEALDPNQAQVIASRLQAAIRQHIDDLRLTSQDGRSTGSAA
jgi:hypothetical protein